MKKHLRFATSSALSVMMWLAPRGATGSEPADLIYSTKVHYLEYHDPGVISLADGRRLLATNNVAAFHTSENWDRGRVLLLAYSLAEGCFLKDPETGSSIGVGGGWGDRHPADLLLAEKMANATTAELPAILEESRQLWDLEAHRVARKLNLSPRVWLEERLAWQQYLAGWSKLASQACATRQGSVWPATVALARQKAARARAEWLSLLAVELGAEESKAQ